MTDSVRRPRDPARSGESAQAGPRRVSRDAFIDATGRLLRRQGYAGTGLNEIVAHSGAPKGSLYFHFPGGKEQLAVAALDREGERLAGAIARMLASSEDLGEALGCLLDSLAAGLERSGYRDGCPIATVALEVAADSEVVWASADAAFASWLRVIGERLLVAGAEPELAGRRALFVLAAIEGALVLARARRDLAPVAAIRRELVELLG
jgi:TetR/AcrR family transcriptional regulator, lmrAB and yxaGH operons repressor